ncbi:GNAT family N-acetyltransferase [Streptomyces sp. TRM43335]|uniref:GNAT family N-acetyltransferase n=1 Tax=Streptomyces taklimakanensis TaxID=2569853 RepID=A0A6G2BCC9_9ACTN|nr:GNAT family N-acetyltransferase [Streptomyces taklimakanensis]MTE19729.1 GNAT family N-acetyltransferase [Streptomyces taklimakanensis]
MVPSAPDIRTVSEEEFPQWFRALRAGFLHSREVSEEEIRVRRDGVIPERVLGAFEPDGRCAATFRTLPQRLTVPGGARVASLAVTNVTVLPTHRRRGLLTRMMRKALVEGKERGDVCSTLDAAEYPIYGRYGYGPATWTTEWAVDAAHAGLDPRRSRPDEEGARIDLVDAEEFRARGAELHERVCALPDRQGMTDRTERWWKLSTGEIGWPGRDSTRPFRALYRDADGRPQGLLTFTTDENWEHNAPRVNARVRDLIAATSAAERALWHFLLSLDWVATVHSGPRAPDSLLPLVLPDPRAARVTTHTDFLWLRPLDVPALLAARAYPVSGSLVLELADPMGLSGGRFLLEASPDGADCVPTTRSADLSMGVGALGSLYLGDESASRLRELGSLVEERPGAAALADVLLRTARRPWAPDEF